MKVIAPGQAVERKREERGTARLLLLFFFHLLCLWHPKTSVVKKVPVKVGPRLQFLFIYTAIDVISLLCHFPPRGKLFSFDSVDF